MGVAIFIALALPLAAQLVEDNRVVTKRFPVSPGGAAPELVVSIVTGNIRVTSHAGSEIVMNAKVHYEAPDAASLADLQQRVRLESEQSGNNVWIGAESDGWNSGSGHSPRSRELGWRGKAPASSPREEGRRWRFRHDIDLQVPRTAHLKLSTVNGGSIEIDGVAGEFNLNNVNGGIEVKNGSGYGRAHTVNGAVSIGFAKAPTGPTSVRTINGKVDLSLPPGLNADFKIKTFNGKVYSDFAMTGRSTASPSAPLEKGMKRIWRSNDFSHTRTGSGGPEIELDGFNGDIYIHEKKN